MNQDLLYKYFKGNANIEEEKQILDWVDASDENRKAFQKERMLMTSPSSPKKNNPSVSKEKPASCQYCNGQPVLPQ